MLNNIVLHLNVIIKTDRHILVHGQVIKLALLAAVVITGAKWESGDGCVGQYNIGLKRDCSLRVVVAVTMTTKASLLIFGL